MMKNTYSLAGCVLKQQRLNVSESFVSLKPFGFKLISGQNLTFVRGNVNVVYDTAASVTPSEDGLAKLIKGIKLQVNSGASYMETLNLQQLVLYNQHLMRGRLTNDQPSGTASQTGVSGNVEFFFSPSLNPRNTSNPKYAIPAQNTRIHDISVAANWGSNADLGTGYTVSGSSTIQIVEQDGWVCDPSVVSERFVSVNGEMALPNWYFGSQDILSSTGNLGVSMPLPNGAIIRNIFLVVKDSSGNRSNSIISDIALQKSNGEYLWGPFSFAQAQKRKADELDITPFTGCYLFELNKDVVGSSISVNDGIAFKDYGEVSLRFTTTATGSIDFIMDTLIPRQV